jgi:hypothetical protein
MASAGSTRGWTDSKLKLTEIQLLDRVHQADLDGEAGFFYAYAHEVGDDWVLVRAAADNLVAEGLINGNRSHSGSLSPTMTPAGTSLVLERRERQSDPRKRAIACCVPRRSVGPRPSYRGVAWCLCVREAPRMREWRPVLGNDSAGITGVFFARRIFDQ